MENRFRRRTIYVLILLFCMFAGGCGGHADETASPTVEPSPAPVPDNLITEADMVHNIAWLKAVYHSSAANSNETGHLVTNGILGKTAESVPLPAISAQHPDHPGGEEPEMLFDKNHNTKMLFRSSKGWVQVDFRDSPAPVIVQYEIVSANDEAGRDPKSWVLQGSNDGVNFTDLDRREGIVFSQRFETQSFAFENTQAYRYYRIDVLENAGNPDMVQFAEWVLWDDKGSDALTLTEAEFSNRWASGGRGEEWLTIDLGEAQRFGKTVLHWGETNCARAYILQISDDAKTWTEVYTKTDGAGGEEVVAFPLQKARYVRLLCTECAGERYELSQWELYGPDPVSFDTQSLPAPESDGTQYLSGGNWKLQRASEVAADGAVLSQAYDDSTWIPAAVPGTVLSSFRKLGAVPDGNFGDYQRQISDSYFTSDFWYRDSFTVPAEREGQTVWLHFDAINWKADIYVNGTQAGRIEGGFICGRFDISALVEYGGENYVAVYIYKNDNPGAVRYKTMQDAGGNGGVLGADNPTIHPSVGWDWVPVIRGRNHGIYGEVFLSYSQNLISDNGYFQTKLNGADASLSFVTDVHNPSDTAKTALVSGVIEPGGYSFEGRITVDAGQTAELTIPGIVLPDAKLWWPNGYGEPFLYTAEITVAGEDGTVSSTQSFNFGVRELSYKTSGALEIHVNGVRIYCRGGNWGMDDSNLEAGAEGYDTKVRLHALENFTMIRNWVGQTNNKAFYDACDKYGILVWDDFWLANPGDGPDPDDEAMFLRNAEDKLKKIRSHPCVVLYCGRNEGNPPDSLNAALDALVDACHPEIHYIPHSASGSVSGFGPYSVQHPAYYFQNTQVTLHSERGMPNIPTIESIKRMLPEDQWWPINEVWALHDFTLGSAQNGQSFLDAMSKYGTYDDLESFSRIAQMVNYENHKAMFEGFAAKGSNGLLMWMSQSAWPSMVWQTYDYYYDTNAAYYALKTANQPINAIWYPGSEVLVLVNHTAQDREDLTVRSLVYDLNGVLCGENSDSASVLSAGTTVASTINHGSAATDIRFIRTQVTDREGIVLGENFYWTNVRDYQDYSALGQMQDTVLRAKVSLAEQKDGVLRYAVTLRNDTDTPALLAHIKAFNARTGKQILPVYFTNNYVSLMPGDEVTLTAELDETQLDGAQPAFCIDGFNIAPADVPLA